MLGQWLKASLLSMLFVSICNGVGLVILGVPMALILAVIAGLLNFIPNFGPLIALIPAALVAMLEGPQTMLYVVILYVAVQVLESTLIRPPLQHKHIHMPPALLIVSQIGMGTLAGAWGVIMATPLVGIGIVLVEQLYMKRQDKEQ